MLKSHKIRMFIAAAFLAVQAGYSQNFIRITSGDVVDDISNFEGCSWGDYNLDGYPDLFVVTSDNGDHNYLYHNNGDQTFTQITTGILVNEFSSSESSNWGDYNNDGFPDLFVANYGPGVPNSLYLNNGDQTFTKVSSHVISDEMGSSLGGSWGDYDNDGYLDLFVHKINDEKNCLYRNNRDGTFAKITAGQIVHDGGDSRTAIWGDYDNDGYIDLFVANGKNVDQNNYLYNNNGNGTFTKITTGDIVNDGGQSVTASWGDYNHDHYLDLFVGNRNQVDFLYLNNTDGTFTKITSGEVVGHIGNTRSSSWADYDNDGDLDLFVANISEKNFLYNNQGDGTFIKLSTGAIVNDIENSKGCCWADYDRDGDLDLFVTNTAYTLTETNAFYQNEGNTNHWIHIKCKGTTTNPSAMGVRVRAKAFINGDYIWQMQEISGQTGHYGQNSLDVEFGLGNATIIDSLVIEWPASGITQVFTHVSANQFMEIKETKQPFPPPPLPHPYIVFQDDFEDGYSDGWVEKTPSRWKVAMDGGSQAYIIKTTNYKPDDGDRPGEYALIDTFQFSDFTLMCNARSTEDLPHNSYADFCIIFGYRNEYDYYTMVFNKRKSETALYKISPDGRSLIQASSKSWVTDNDFHRIRIIREGSEIWVMFDLMTVLYVNGFDVAGQIGVGSYNDAASFDDVVIRVNNKIKITYPDHRHIVWKTGQQYPIKWVSTPDVGSHVRLELFKNDHIKRLINSITKNDGSSSWRVPQSMESHTKYQIKIISISDPSFYDLSDHDFRITDEVSYTASMIPDHRIPVLDGHLNDPVWSLVNPDTLLWHGPTDSWNDFKNGLVTWKTVWCEQTNKLYIAVDVRDDVRSIFDNGPSSANYLPWYDDSIDFYTDGNHSGGYYTDQYGPAQQWRVTGENHRDLLNYPDSKEVHLYQGNDFITAVQWGANGNWTCEAVMTIYNDLPSQPRDLKIGDIIGWEMRYNDSDNMRHTGSYYRNDRQLGWCFYGIEAFKNSSYFGELILSGDIPNQQPVAVDDSITVFKDQAVVLDVLLNDSDPDGDVLTVISIDTTGLLGHCVIESGDTTVIYTPLSGYLGGDSFGYMVSDGRGGTDTASVFIEVIEVVNHPPIAENDFAFTPSSQSVTIHVLKNDIDPDGDPLYIEAIDTTDVVGEVNIDSGDTTVTFTPIQDLSDKEIFAYIASDGRGGRDTAYVMVDVFTVNHPPFAVDDTMTVTQEGPVVIAPLNNDQDPDGDVLTVVSIDTTGLLGHCSIESGDTLITYTSPIGFAGIDQFKYVVGDGQGGLDTGLVVIEVEPVTEVQSENIIPTEFALHQNFPNPFNPSSTITYQIPEKAHVHLAVYNICGYEIATLVNRIQNPGVYKVTWNCKGRLAQKVTSGVYFYRLETTGFTQTRKMLYVR